MIKSIKLLSILLIATLLYGCQEDVGIILPPTPGQDEDTNGGANEDDVTTNPDYPNTEWAAGVSMISPERSGMLILQRGLSVSHR